MTWEICYKKQKYFEEYYSKKKNEHGQSHRSPVSNFCLSIGIKSLQYVVFSEKQGQTLNFQLKFLKWLGFWNPFETLDKEKTPQNRFKSNRYFFGAIMHHLIIIYVYTVFQLLYFTQTTDLKVCIWEQS